MKNKKVRLFFIAQSLAAVYFWIAIAIPYLLYRGLTSTQVFSLMSIYQLMGVILEYPTGVIGDRFGYRKMAYLSNTLSLISMLVMSLSGGYFLYLFALTLLAIGNGFMSGNDMGILKSISTNIKRDTSNYNSLVDFSLFLSAIVGGLIGKISFELALIVSGVCMFCANIPLFLLKDGINQKNSVASLVAIAKDGVKILSNTLFLQLIVFVALFGGYAFTVKSILGSFGSIYSIDVVTVGFFVGIGGLFRSIGGKLFAEYPTKSVLLISIMTALLVLVPGVSSKYTIVLGSMMSLQVFLGYIQSKVDGDIHDLASDHVRASVFSLKRLIVKLCSSIYLAIYGYAIGVGQFSLVMYGIGVSLILAVILSWKYVSGDFEVVKS